MNKKSMIALLTASLCALSLTVTGCGGSEDTASGAAEGDGASGEAVTITWGAWAIRRTSRRSTRWRKASMRFIRKWKKSN